MEFLIDLSAEVVPRITGVKGGLVPSVGGGWGWGVKAGAG